MRRAISYLLLPLTFSAATLGVASCSATDEVVMTTADLASSVESAAAKSMAAETQSMRMTSKLDGETIIDMEGEGRSDGTMFRGSTTMAGQDPMDFLQIGTDFYYAYPDRPAGIDWVKLTAADLAAIGVNVDNMSNQESSTGLAIMSEVGDDIQLVGADTINDEPMDHYRYTVDLAARNRESGALSGKMLDVVEGLMGGPVEMDAWIDDDGFVGRLEYQIDLAEAPDPPAGMPDDGVLSYRFDLRDYDAAVEVEAPSDDVVLSFDDYRSLVQQAEDSDTE